MMERIEIIASSAAQGLWVLAWRWGNGGWASGLSGFNHCFVYDVLNV